MEAGREVKALGRDNNLLELISKDNAFNLGLTELKKAMEPSRYIGRAKEQTEAFLANVVSPVLEKYKDMLGMHSEINV